MRARRALALGGGGILFVTLKDKRSVNMVLLSQNEQLVKIGLLWVCVMYSQALR